MTNDLARLMAVIGAAERDIPVNDWKCGDLLLWPLARVRLFFSAHSGQFTTSRAPTGASRFVPRSVRQVGELVAGGCARTIAGLRDADKRSRRSGPVDALFMSDGLSFVRTDAGWLDRFCEPLIDELIARGRRSLMLVPRHEYYIPRRTPAKWIQGALDRRTILGLVSSRMLRADCQMPGYERLAELLRGAGWSADMLPQSVLSTDGHRVIALARYFESVVRKAKPRVVFVVNYYSIAGSALIYACRRLGVPTVDLQHGVQSAMHAAYAQFSVAPESGYNVLPDWFWVWSEEDAAAVDEWTARRPTRHATLVGGNPWLEMWLDGSSPTARRTDEVLRHAVGRTGGRRQAMATLQTGLRDELFLTPLIEIIRRTRQEWFWWIRLHPAMLEDHYRIEGLLRSSGVDNWEMDQATVLPLYGWLRHIDLHYTFSSSTIIEAEHFGVPSVAWGDVAPDLYPGPLERGVLRLASDDVTENLAILERFEPRAVAARDVPGSRFRDALMKLIDPAGDAGAASRAPADQPLERRAGT